MSSSRATAMSIRRRTISSPSLAKVHAKQVKIQAVILVTHDTDGNVSVQRTGDNLGRKGLGYGGAVGLLVGLAAPPLLAATVIGAAAGGIVGQVRRPQGADGPPRQARRGDEAGHGRDHRDVRRGPAPRRRAGAARSSHPVDRPDRQEGRRGAQGLARRGDGQVQPGPHRPADPGPHLRRHHGPDDGHVGGRLVVHPRAATARGRAERPRRPRRRRRLRRPGHVRRRAQDART